MKADVDFQVQGSALLVLVLPGKPIDLASNLFLETWSSSCVNSCSKHKTSGRVGVSDSGWANRLKKKGLEKSGVWKGEEYPFIIDESPVLICC